MRQCVGCGEMKNKKEMMRVLKTSEGEVLLDTGLARSFKMNIPDEIYDKLEKEFEENVQG